jgi:hypothetical protein
VKPAQQTTEQLAKLMESRENANNLSLRLHKDSTEEVIIYNQSENSQLCFVALEPKLNITILDKKDGIKIMQAKPAISVKYEKLFKLKHLQTGMKYELTKLKVSKKFGTFA